MHGQASAAANDGRFKRRPYIAAHAHRWAPADGCPASAILRLYAPRRPSPKVASEGTQAHKLLEKLLKKETVLTRDYPLKACEGTAAAVEYINQFRTSASREYIEERFQMNVAPWLAPEDAILSRPDAVVWEPNQGFLHIFNYKHGVQPVSAERNYQLMHEALCIFENAEPDADVTLHVIQPFGYDGKSEDEWSWTPTLEDLLKFKAEVLAAIEANAHYHLTGSLDFLTYRPSAKNCKKCPAFDICPAAKVQAYRVVYPEFTAPMTGPDMARELEHARFLEVWISEIKAAAHAMAMSGTYIPGSKLVEPQPHRRWIKEHEEIATELFRITQGFFLKKDLFSEEILTPAQAEKVFKEKLKLLGITGAAKTKAMLEFAKLSERPKAATLHLVPADDKRPAVNPRDKLAGITLIPQGN